MTDSEFALGAELSLNGPGEVNLNDEFKVSISYDESEVYDVKIVVQSIPDKKSLSEIFYDEKWTSSFYFVIGAYPANKEFKVRVKTFSENSELCAKIRKTSDKKGQKENCVPIKIISGSDNQDNQSVNESNEQNISSDDRYYDYNDSIVTSSKFNNYEKLSSAPKQTNERIVLGNDVKTKVLITKEEKIRLGIVYSFAALCVLLIILMSFNRL